MLGQLFYFYSLAAGLEVKYLIGRIPSAVGYQATLCTEISSIQERIVVTKLGSITSIQAIFVGHLDAITVLFRALAMSLERYNILILEIFIGSQFGQLNNLDIWVKRTK